MLPILSPNSINRINDTLVQASLAVASVYYDYVNDDADIDIQKKSDASPVTKADILLHKLISKSLNEITPEVFCLSEESEHEKTDRQDIETLWLLDPVDGTRAFIGKTGEFTVNLALIHQQKIVASWLVVPMQAELYCSFDTLVLEEGAYQPKAVYAMSFLDKLPKKYDEILLDSSISVNSSRPNLTEHLTQIGVNVTPLAEMLLQQEKLSEQNDKTIKIGLSRSAQMSDYQPFIDALKSSYACDVQIVQASSAYKFVQMLRDEIDVYVRAYPTCEWDTASGQGLIEAIGGGLFNFRGNTFLYNYRDTLKNGGFICFKHINDKQTILTACKDLIEED